MADTALTGRIVVPGDPDYDAARLDFNTRYSRCPLVILFAQRVQDVQHAVRWANEHHLPIRIRSGRHSFEALSVADCGIVIDVSEMRRVELDLDRGLVHVQAGTTTTDLYEFLARQGVTVPSGTCPGVGIAGLVLGGGIGMLSRQFGLLADHLCSVEMVDGFGRVLIADETQNADLFWALRGGGGGNFGIATSFTFEVIPVQEVAFALITWPLSQFSEVVSAWQRFAPFTDERLTATLEVSVREESITSEVQFNGPEGALRRLLAPLLAAGVPTEVEIRTVPFIEAVRAVAARDPNVPRSFKSTGGFVDRLLPAAGIETLRRFLAANPNRRGGIWMQSLGGVIGCVSPEGTAYIHRRAKFIIELVGTWTDPSEEEPVLNWVNQFRRAMKPFFRGTYVNWPDLDIPDWPGEYYGTNFRRLRRVKRRYDPLNIFRFQQSIPPAIWPW